jgi:hypothetical protein
MPHTQFLFSFEQITKLLLMKKSGEGVQGRREVGGGWGKFFGGPYFKIFSGEQQFFRGKYFPDEYVAIAFQRLYLNFSYQFSVLCPKKTNILPFARKYLTQKNE